MIGKRVAAVFAALVVMSALASADIVEQLGGVCYTIVSIVPIVALLMFVTAGLVYAAGQIMGAETRSRANVWSTAMLVGGIIGLVLAASAPYFLQIFAQAALGGTSIVGGTAACAPVTGT
ncbi:MAG: hypothetical protein AB1468_00470 [Candidatus Micrarchaeota archaeon]